MPFTDRGVLVIGPDEGRTVHLVGDTYTFKAVADQTDGALTLWHAFVPPQGGPPPHIHHREAEAFYLLEGELQFMADWQTIAVGAGSFVYVPKGTPHAFKNEGSAPAKMLLLCTPAGVEGLFFDSGTAAQPGTVAAPPDQAEIDRLLAVAPKYDVEILPPP